MAIVFNTSSAGTSPVNATAGTVAHIYSGINGILFAGIVDEAGDTITGVTYAGSTMTQVAKVLHSADSTELYIYYILSPNSGANNIIASRTGTIGNIGLINSSYNNVTGTDSNGTQYLATGTAGTLSVTTSANNCWTVLLAKTSAGSIVADQNATFVTGIPGNAWSILDNSGYGNISPPGAFSMVYTTQSSTGKAAIMTAFSPAASGQSGLQSKYW